MALGKAKGKISIRRAQLKMLEAGNATMGVWLGKQYLDQTDELEIRGAQQCVIVMPCAPKALTKPNDEIQVDVEPAYEAKRLLP